MKQPIRKTPVERLVESVGSVPSLIIHTILFLAVFSLSVFGVVDWQIMLLTLTTVISIEAIYLALFIQIAVNRNTAQLREVEEDIDEIQEDVEELGEDVEDIQEDIEEISEDIDEIQEDVEDMTDEEKEAAEKLSEPKVRKEKPKKSDSELLEDLTKDINRLLRDLEELKKGK